MARTKRKITSTVMTQQELEEALREEMHKIRKLMLTAGFPESFYLSLTYYPGEEGLVLMADNDWWNVDTIPMPLRMHEVIHYPAGCTQHIINKEEDEDARS